MRMQTNWYYLDPSRPENEQRIGPFDRSQMEQFLQDGKLTKAYLIWHPGLTTWIKWEDYEPEITPEKLIEAPAENGEQRAVFWQRALATLTDLAILAVANMVLFAIYQIFFGVTPKFIEESLVLKIPSFILEATYQIWFITNYGATPGKMLLGLKVLTLEGEKLTQSQAIKRYFAYLLSALTLGIGFLMVAIDPQKRALHDILSKTKVIKLPTNPE